jgi:hypothetical protein
MYFLQIIDGIVVGYATSRDVFPEGSQIVEIYSINEPIEKLGTSWV